MNTEINEGIIVQGQGHFQSEATAVGSHASIVWRAPAGGEVGPLLEQLREAIARVPAGEPKQRLERTCETLQAEVQSKRPDRQWARITAQGLLEAAKAVKDIAPDILATAMAVAKFFVAA